jgi:hypothetical protein
MTEKTHAQLRYEQWLETCREVSPPADLADEIMSQVAKLESQRRNLWWLRLVQQIERSRAARWAVCMVALAIGGIPFVMFANVSSF